MKELNFSNIKLSEIMKSNREFGTKLASLKPYNISLISNVTLNPLKDILEFSLRHQNINAQVSIGDYDNFIQNTLNLNSKDCLVYFWEICNLTSGLHYKADLLNPDELGQLISKTKSEIKTCLDAALKVPLVIFNKFSTLSFNYNSIEEKALDRAAQELNYFIQSLNLNNLVLIDTNKVLVSLGIEHSITMQHYYSSKTLHTVNFLKNYTEFITPIFINVCGKSKKALILDCDNTLWKGIIGEQGVEGINCSPENNYGEPYYEAQAIIKKCANQGIIIGLCSKNNPEDVESVLNKNSSMLLQQNDIVIKKVNWENKTKNLVSISKELNIGIDSLVFVDDSEFEVDQVKENLPGVMTILVPQKSFNYPSQLRKAFNYFFQLTRTEEDKKKIQMYQEQSIRDNEKNGFENINEYLKNLKLKLSYKTQIEEELPRLSQLTLKTNQFNATAHRYTETELRDLQQEGSLLMSYKLEDKYGDYGIIGFTLAHISNETASIDTFLMSCRAIGRQVEFCMFEIMLNILKEKGVRHIHAAIVKNSKNIPVQNLYTDLGFHLVETEGSQNEIINYTLNLENYKFPTIHFVEYSNAN